MISIPESLSNLIATAQSTLGGPAGWFILAAAICGWLMKVYVPLRETITNERNADLKRKTIATEQIADLSKKDISPEIKKLLEKGFLAVAGIKDLNDEQVNEEIDNANKSDAAVSTTSVNIEYALTSLVICTLTYPLMVFLHWMLGWTVAFTYYGSYFTKTSATSMGGTTTISDFKDYSIVIIAAFFAFVLSRLFIPFRKAPYTIIVAFFISILFFS